MLTCNKKIRLLHIIKKTLRLVSILRLSCFEVWINAKLGFLFFSFFLQQLTLFGLLLAFLGAIDLAAELLLSFSCMLRKQVFTGCRLPTRPHSCVLCVFYFLLGTRVPWIIKIDMKIERWLHIYSYYLWVFRQVLGVLMSLVFATMFIGLSCSVCVGFWLNPRY